MKNGCCETPISFYMLKIHEQTLFFLNKNLVVWKMFIKFVAFKMHEQKQNSEHL